MLPFLWPSKALRSSSKTTRSGSWEGGVTASGKTLGVVTINKTDVSRYSFRLGDRSTHKAVSTKYQDKATGKLAVVNLNNDDALDGLPPVHTDRHIHPNKTAAEQAAKARLAAFNRTRPVYGWKCPGALICSQNG